MADLDEAGHPVLAVSWSRLKAWEECHQASALYREGRVSTLRDGRVFLIGNLADRALRNFLEQPDGTHQRGQLAEWVDQLWDYWAVQGGDEKDQIRWRGNPREDKERVRELAKRCVTNMEEWLWRKVLPLEYEAAVRFRVPLRIPDLSGRPRTIALRGEIDLAVRDPATGRFLLVDLKATENEQYVTGPTLGQLVFYPVAWSIHQQVPALEVDAAFITPLCKTQWRPLRYDEAEYREALRAMVGRIIAYAHSVWRDQPEDRACTTDESPCFRCDVKHACPKFQAPVSVTAKGRHKLDLRALAATRSAVRAVTPTPAGAQPEHVPTAEPETGST